MNQPQIRGWIAEHPAKSVGKRRPEIRVWVSLCARRPSRGPCGSRRRGPRGAGRRVLQLRGERALRDPSQEHARLSRLLRGLSAGGVPIPFLKFWTLRPLNSDPPGLCAEDDTTVPRERRVRFRCGWACGGHAGCGVRAPCRLRSRTRCGTHEAFDRRKVDALQQASRDARGPAGSARGGLRVRRLLCGEFNAEVHASPRTHRGMCPRLWYGLPSRPRSLGERLRPPADSLLVPTRDTRPGHRRERQRCSFPVGAPNPPAGTISRALRTACP